MFITTPLWLMPIVTIIINTSYTLVTSTYMNGTIGFWLFISLPSVLAIITMMKLFNIYKNNKKYLFRSAAGCFTAAIIGTFLTFVSIISGGYTIA